jgi:hypothetical protein
MTEPLSRNTIDRLSALVAFLFGRLIGLAAGPELRVSYAIAQAAKRARKRSGKW